MADSTMALDGILSKLLSNGGGDLLRSLVEQGLQALINLEAATRLGADRYERSEDRVTYRNGTRERELDTRVGTVSLDIPKFRKGAFMPGVLQPRRRSEQALLSVIQEAYIQGVSTRKVDAIIQAMGLADNLDKSAVSRICKGLSEKVEEFRNRPLEDNYLYVWFDATYIKVRCGGRVKNQAFIIAVGVGLSGERQVLGFTMSSSESYSSWIAFFRSLVARGLTNPALVISDAHEGLKRAAQEVFSGASWQRCKVHYMRNVLSIVPKTQQPVVSAALKQIFMQTDLASAEATLETFAQRFEEQLPKVATKLREECSDALSFLAFPPEHWRQIHSTNGLERLNRELKRRSDVVGIFPNDDSVLRLLGTILAEQSDEWIVCNRLFSQQSMKKVMVLLEPAGTEAAALSAEPTEIAV